MKKFFFAVLCVLSVLAFVACETEPEINVAPAGLEEVIQLLYDDLNEFKMNATPRTSQSDKTKIVAIDTDEEFSKTEKLKKWHQGNNKNVYVTHFNMNEFYEKSTSDSPESRYFNFEFTLKSDSYIFYGDEKLNGGKWKPVSYKIYENDRLIWNSWKPAKK